MSKHIKKFLSKYLTKRQKNFYYKTLGRFLFSIFNKKDCLLVKQNKKYKNFYAKTKNRCFILGNGPSLLSQDLLPLKSEYVFAVNLITRADFYKNIKVDYHFLSDSNIFNYVNSFDDEILQSLLNLKTLNNNPICFWTLKSKEIVEKYSLNKTLNINYFLERGLFYENFNSKIDFSKSILGFSTVVQYAICMAIYMGFSEIYLLGCDCTDIITSANARLKKNNNAQYSYKISKIEDLRMQKEYTKNSFLIELNAHITVINHYKSLYEYCKKRNIKLINCTLNSLLDVIPYEKYENML